MGANMRCEKNSLALLSSKRTKAFARTRADEAFALPSFSDAAPTFTMESPCRSGGGPKLEYHSDDVERLKQTMMRHESMFKEQLYELHRLYQVQRILMEEAKSSASHLPSDSPSSNSSLLYNPDLCKPKEERRFWDPNDARNVSPCKQLCFFPGQIDMNKPHEDKTYTERLVNTACTKDSQRPLIDLERPAEENMEIEMAEEKPLVSDTFLKTVRHSHIPHVSWQALQSSSLLEKNADTRMYMEKNNSVHRESPGSMRRSFQECFMPELSRHKEVPFFPSGPSKSQDCLAEEANPRPAQTIPITSLFGVSLKQEYTYKDNRLSPMQSNLEENNRKEPQNFGIDAHHSSKGETSRLPHWLLQGSSTISAKTSPVNSTAQTSLRQHKTLPVLLQKQDERKANSFFDERVCSIYTQELSNSWPKSGTRLNFGESFLRAPEGKLSAGYLPDASTELVQGFHKLPQTNSANESIHSKDEWRMGVQRPISATGYAPSPVTDRCSQMFETHAAPSVFLPELSSMPPWYQQKISSPLKPQVSKPGFQNQRSLNAFSVNSLNAWATASASEVRPGVGFLARTGDFTGGNNREIKGSSPSLFTRPEVYSKRLIFEFMPTASDLELTLSLDTDASDTFETPKKVENSSSFEDVANRYSKIDFDLNVQSAGQGLDACCPAESHIIPTISKQESEARTSLVWPSPNGVKPGYFEEWQTLHTSSNLKGIPEVAAITSTVTPIQTTNSSFTKVGMHKEAGYAEGLRFTSAFVAGKSSDGSALTSCESRNMSIPALSKARDDSNTSSGEACQSREVKISSRNECAAFSMDRPTEKLLQEASMMAGRQPGMFSTLLSCSDQGDTAKDLLCTDVDNCEGAAQYNASNHVAEAFEAADILLHLGLDLPSVVIEDHEADDQERALKWLADMIPQDEISGIDGGMAGLTVRENTLAGSEPSLEDVGVQEKKLDSFELSVLRLKPIDPDTEKVSTQLIEKCDLGEECSPLPNLRRRSLRRGRVGRDFQKEMLPSISSLSRQEITEDLQIIEGLVKSATEAMAKCSLSPKEDSSWSLPELSSVKPSGKAKGSRSCKAGKQNGLLRVCSWGESTRRRRMRRQRSQWMCLPPGV